MSGARGTGAPRVLIVSSYFPPHIGGVEVVAAQQARSLAAAGHETVVATTALAAAPARERVDGYTVVRLPASDLVERRVGVPYPVLLPASVPALWRLVRWCDLVHVHDVLYQPPQAAAVLAHLAGRPLCVTQHIGPVTHHSPLVRAVERASCRTLGRYVWRRARAVAAHSPLAYEHLRAHGVPERRIVRTSSGIDTSAFAPGPVPAGTPWRERLGLPPGVPVVLFTGRLIRQKGVDLLLEAADPAYRVVLAGPGTPPRPLPPGVVHAGALERTDLVALYRLADVFALPCAGEVFPLGMQEAMACGLPVVTTDDPRYDGHGVRRDLLRLVPRDATALRRAILDVLTTPGLRDRMGRYARDFAVRHFDWRRNQESLWRLHGAALAGTGGVPVGSPG